MLFFNSNYSSLNAHAIKSVMPWKEILWREDDLKKMKSNLLSVKSWTLAEVAFLDHKSQEEKQQNLGMQDTTLEAASNDVHRIYRRWL